jgi:hypothetical protein
MAEKVKAPAIRFKGFTDDWEQRKLLAKRNTTMVRFHLFGLLKSIAIQRNCFCLNVD